MPLCTVSHGFAINRQFVAHFCFCSWCLGMPIMLGANPIPNSNDPLSLNLTTEANSTMTTAPSKWDMVDQSSSAAAKTNGSSLAAGPEEKAGNKQDEGFVCAFYNPDFIIYSSLGSFYIPCIVMVFIYVRIFKVNKYKHYSIISIVTPIWRPLAAGQRCIGLKV